MSRVALFEVILARVQTVYHIPPRLVLTLMSESWRAPLVSSCVAKAIHCKSKGQEGDSRGRGAEERAFSCIDFLSFFFSLSFLQKQMLRERERKHFHVFSLFIYTCMLRGKIMKYREHVSPLWLTRGSLQESILFNLTFMAASER